MNQIKKQLAEITCVFEGLDGKGAIYISGIQPAKSLEVLKSTFLKKNRKQNQSSSMCSQKWIRTVFLA